MMEASREPEILGILLIVQNALCALEVLDGAGALVERALLCIPGLQAARVKLDGDLSCPPCSSADGVNRTLPVATLHRSFGHVEVEFADEAAFRPYEPFVYNMMSTLALLLENRCQRRQLQTELSRREERARQQAEEAMRIKDEFLATVSHELRTPLTAVLGWVTILQSVQGKDSDALQKGLEIIGRNVRAQARIIEDVLDISHIVTGKLRVEPQAVSLDAVVRDAIEIVALSVSAKRLTLRYHPSDDPCVVFADPTRLRQIVWNLLSNATKFTPNEGRIDVLLRLEAEAVSLRVIDSGIGIAQDCLPHVFERFWQADASRTRAYGGLGLGLAIVRHLAELHGGSIEVESAGAGRGASFTLRLPAHATAQNPRYPERQQEP